MEETRSRVVPLIIGIVFIIIIIIIAVGGYLYFSRRSGQSQANQNSNSTPTPTPQETVMINNTADNDQGQVLGTISGLENGQELDFNVTVTEKDGTVIAKGGVPQIPKTGINFLILPFTSMAIASGFYLRKKS